MLSNQSEHLECLQTRTYASVDIFFNHLMYIIDVIEKTDIAFELDIEIKSHRWYKY